MRSICIPSAPPVDLSGFERIIDLECFQRLRDRKQLGVNHLVFPGAVHTRFEHVIGVLALTQRLCRIQGLAGEDARHLQAFALLHDVGHGPFSHQIEPVLVPANHHSHGMQLIRSIADTLEALGLSTERLIQMLDDKDALASWVADRNLGADKLDYLARDALHIGFRGTPDIERIQAWTVPTPEGPAIEEKYVEDVKELQKFYSYLHQHGYLNKTALAAQRMLQRACQETILAGADPAPLWDMVDAELLFWLLQNGTNLARQLTQALLKRDLHRSFLVLKPAGYGWVEREATKPICVLERGRGELRNFCEKYTDLTALRTLEDELASACDLAPGDILFAAMPYFKKLFPRDLRVFASGGHGSYWLFEKDGDHRRSLESDYLRTFAVRLVCPAKYRQRLASLAEKVILPRLL
ncbi:MAG: HD domain-containing protein [Victivallales bacterium]|nr:HD domain-containing protein [Victivallales bacterium]